MSDRNIKVTYYADAKKNYEVAGSSRWFKYARNASMKAFDAMVQNLYGSDVCTVYDDSIGKLLYEFVRHKDSNKVSTTWDHEAVENGLYTAQSPQQFKNFTSKKSKSAQVRAKKTKK